MSLPGPGRAPQHFLHVMLGWHSLPVAPGRLTSTGHVHSHAPLDIDATLRLRKLALPCMYSARWETPDGVFSLFLFRTLPLA